MKYPLYLFASIIFLSVASLLKNTTRSSLPDHPQCSTCPEKSMSPSWWVMGKTAAVQADAFPCVFILNTKGDDVLVIAPDSIPGHDLLVEVNLVFHDATVTIAGKPYLPATMLAFRYLDEHDLLPKKNN